MIYMYTSPTLFPHLCRLKGVLHPEFFKYQFFSLFKVQTCAYTHFRRKHLKKF